MTRQLYSCTSRPLTASLLQCRRECTQHRTAEQLAAIYRDAANGSSYRLQCVRVCALESLFAASQSSYMIGHFCLTSNDHCQLRLRSDSVTLRGCQGRHSCSIYRHTKDSVYPRSTSDGIILFRDSSWGVSPGDGTVF